MFRRPRGSTSTSPLFPYTPLFRSEEFTELRAGKELPELPSLPPVDLAAVAASPAGLRKSEASLRNWERIRCTGPQEMFAEPRGRRPGTDEEARQLTIDRKSTRLKYSH